MRNFCQSIPEQSVSDDDDDELKQELLNLLNSFNAMKKKKKQEKKLRAITSLHEYICSKERINVLSLLPFLHTYVIDWTGQRTLTKGLVDYGATVSVIAKKICGKK